MFLFISCKMIVKLEIVTFLRKVSDACRQRPLTGGFHYASARHQQHFTIFFRIFRFQAIDFIKIPAKTMLLMAILELARAEKAYWLIARGLTATAAESISIRME